MDTIIIRQLQVQTVIGVFPVERQFRQILKLDLDLATDAKKIAQSDSMEHAIDYAAVCTFIERFAEQNSFHMIETFAQKLSESLAHAFNVHDQIITVYKPGSVLSAQTVGIRIERGHFNGCD